MTPFGAAGMVLVVVVCTAAWVLARRRRGQGWRGRERVLAVIESACLTPQVSLHVVTIAGRPIVVAAGPAGGTVICHVDAPVQSHVDRPPKPKRVRLLIVDDAAVMRMLAATILRAHGFDVVGEAANAAEASVCYRELRPDVVIANVAPDSSAHASANASSVLREILRADADASVIVSGYAAQRPLIDAAIAHGARAYVAKPFHPAHLVEAVRRVHGQAPPSTLLNPEDVRERAENRRV